MPSKPRSRPAALAVREFALRTESQSMAFMLPFAEFTGCGMGKSAWVTARFSGRDDVPLGLLVQWIEEGYSAIAPKKLAALVRPRSG